MCSFVLDSSHKQCDQSRCRTSCVTVLPDKNGSGNDATKMKSGASEGNALWMLSPMMQLSIYIIKLHADPSPEKNKNCEISLRGPSASENPVPLCMGP